jgi:ubiquitin carboxyl-terminal hydrolase 36/42
MNSETGGLSGLVNLGNTCFMNTSIQCLGHIDSLRNFIVTNNFNETTQKCCYQLKRLLIGLWENNCTVNPISFHKTIKEIAKKEKVNINFTKNIQNDIQEFIIFVIEVIEKELGESNTFIKDNFYGELITYIKDVNPPKKLLSQTKQSFCVLPLPVYASNKIQGCLDLYMNEEKLEGDNKWYNEKTKEFQDALKSYGIVSFPRELIISFNRFRNNGLKINNNIEFPDILELKSATGKVKKYELKSIGNHSGNLFGGHYFAHVKHGKEWVIYNDTGVQQLNSDYKTNQSYVLFYTLCKN